MTARVWTLAELAEVWPLPEGWSWQQVIGGGEWSAVARFAPDEWAEVWVDGENIEHTSTGEDIPGRVFVAVWGAHLGHDSPEWMAREMETRADAAKDRASVHRQGRQTAMANSNDGQETGYRSAAAMLRRGRVEP